MIEHECIRKEIMGIISAMIPFDPQEQEHIDFVRTWIASGAEIFRIAKPDEPKIHLVSYFVLIDPSSNELLLADHKKAGLWLPPGGHAEPGEHPKTTVQREIQEELQIEAEFLFDHPQFITVTETIGNVSRHTDVSLWYVLRGSSKTLLKFDIEEFHQIRWFLPNEVPYKCADPHMRRFVEKVMKKTTTLNSYNASAVQYAHNTTQLHPNDEAQKFIKLLPAQAKIIDIGCGPGRDAKVFSDYGLNVVGIDFSFNMIEAAKQTAPQATFFVMDIEHITFPSESFDGVWANSALLHISKKNVGIVLEKLYDILKPKGLLYLSVKHGNFHESFEKDSRYDGLEKFWSFFEKDELLHLLSRTNFEIKDVTIAQRVSDYQTHPLIEIFAKKP